MSFFRPFIALCLVLLLSAPASAGSITVPDTLTAAQFHDLVNELALATAPPILGPEDTTAAWRPWLVASYNVRAFSPVENAWLYQPGVWPGGGPQLHMPAFEGGVALPGSSMLGLLYARAPEKNLGVAGLTWNYPFLLPSADTPGLWARLVYARPHGVRGVSLHLPTAGLYLTNELLRTPAGGRPMTLAIHAGLLQALAVAFPEREAAGDLTFPASTQFLVGLGLSWRGWSLGADVSYASSQTILDNVRRTRSLWNQAYRLAYRFGGEEQATAPQK